MVLNYIWIAFFLIAFVIGLVRLVFMGDAEVFPAMMNSTFSSAKTAFEISLGLTGVLSLWLGVMKIGERGGVVDALAKVLSPVFTKLFPDIPKGHPATGSSCIDQVCDTSCEEWAHRCRFLCPAHTSRAHCPDSRSQRG